MANSYTIDYNDKRLTSITDNKNNAINNSNQTYDNMINESDQKYNDLINLQQQNADKQAELQQQRTDFAKEKVEQQKQLAEQDYTREQKAAYADYAEQTAKFGNVAERMASNGLTNSGYSESSQVSMFNAYQNRYATARASYNQAVMNYDNAIKDIELSNNSALLEIYNNALEKQLTLSLQGMQYKNSLLSEKIDKSMALESLYQSQYNSMLSQMNTENAMKYQQDRDKIADQQWQKQYELQKASTAASIRASNATASSNPYGNGSNPTLETKYFKGKMSNLQIAAISKYGAFSTTVDKNGVPYQPKGVIYDGHDYGKITEANVYTRSNYKNSSGVDVSNQKVWKTDDGKYWIWNGSKMTYEPLDKKDTAPHQLKSVK